MRDVVRLCAERGVPVTPRGAGTGLSGGAVPARQGVVLATARLRRILEVDAVERTATVEPGVPNIRLSEVAAEHGLFYAPDPSSQKACTIGGNVAENAGGPHCLALGVTTNHVIGLEVVTASGEVEWLGSRGPEPAGYDLRGLFIGSEGTLGIATKVVVRLLPVPETVVTLLAIFDDVERASETVSAVVGAGLVPAALEMMDRVTLQAAEAGLRCGYPPDAGAVLLIELDGIEEVVATQIAQARAACNEHGATEIRLATEPVRARAAVEGTQGGDRLARAHRAQLLPARWRRTPLPTRGDDAGGVAHQRGVRPACSERLPRGRRESSPLPPLRRARGRHDRTRAGSGRGHHARLHRRRGRPHGRARRGL